MTMFPASENAKEKLITVSQKGTTEPLLLSFLACSFWFLSLLVSLAGDSGASTWLCSPLCSLSLELLLHQKRIPLLSLSQVLMAHSGKNRCENQKVTLRITCNCPFLRGLVFGHSDNEGLTEVGCSGLDFPPKLLLFLNTKHSCNTSIFYKNKTNLF